MSSIKDRILQVADLKEVRRNTFFKKLGASYSNYRGRSKKSSPSSDIIAEISSYYSDVNINWLLTGKGDMLLEEKRSNTVQEPPVPYKGAQINVIEITPETSKTNTLIADVHASAGFGSLMESKQALEQLPSIYLPNAPYGLNIAFQVNGDSMHPTIRHLDYVAGNRIYNLEDIRDGHTYIVVDRDDGVLCKRVYRLGSDWQLVSDNPIYRPYNRSKKEIIAFFKAFCRWSYDFRSYYDDLRADIQQLKINTEALKQEIAHFKTGK